MAGAAPSFPDALVRAEAGGLLASLEYISEPLGAAYCR